MGDHGDGPRPRGPMSNHRFYALLVFALLVIALVCGTINAILSK
jgi:hypothetical protein